MKTIALNQSHANRLLASLSKCYLNKHGYTLVMQPKNKRSPMLPEEKELLAQLGKTIEAQHNIIEE